MRTLSSVHKIQREMKQQNTTIHEGIEGVHLNEEQHHKTTLRKMNEYHNAISQRLQDMDSINGRSPYRNDREPEMHKLSNLTAQLTENMNTAAMLSVLRNEYENVRKEKEAMRMEVERYRRENDALSLRKQLLEEEAITNREAKRRTIKNLVDELNEMREQIHRLTSQRK